MFYYQPHTGRFEQSSRSSVRSSVYSPVYSPLPVRSYDDDMLYVPFRPLYTGYGRYDTTGEENASRSQINRELILSSAALEDNYDLSLRSRNRDKDVLAAANRAIVDTEIHSSPRSAVAAKRAMRGQSTPPPSTFLSKTEVHVALARAKSNNLGYIVPPASARYQRPRSARVTINPRYRFTVPKRTRRNVQRYLKTRETISEPDIEGLRRAPRSILAYLRNLELRLMSKRFKPSSTYVPVRSAYKKAALIGSKVDVVSPDRGYRRRPRSAYAQAKIRQMATDKRHVGVEPVVVAESTSDLKASKPVYTPALIKPIHEVDGIKKPSNILSWQYKLDAITSPDDFIIVPRSLSSVKAQLRDAQDKMVKHRQLMDRYLDADTGLTVDDKMALSASKAHLGTRA